MRDGSTYYNTKYFCCLANSLIILDGIYTGEIPIYGYVFFCFSNFISYTCFICLTIDTSNWTEISYVLTFRGKKYLSIVHSTTSLLCSVLTYPYRYTQSHLSKTFSRYKLVNCPVCNISDFIIYQKYIGAPCSH